MTEIVERLRPLAEFVRAEAEAWARKKGYDDVTLVMLCAPVSFAFVRLCRAVGLDAEVAVGDHVVGAGHCWALAAERQGRPQRWESRDRAAAVWGRGRSVWADLTATQFDGERIVLLPPGDSGRGTYVLDDFGDDLVTGFLWDRDKPDVVEFSARVMAAAAQTGLIPAPVLEAGTEETCGA